MPTAEPPSSHRVDVTHLQGPDTCTAPIALSLAMFQVGLSVWACKLPLIWYVVWAYVVGATVAQALFLAVHEVSHGLAFRGHDANTVLLMLLNVPLVFPFSIAFREYHLEHHRHTGKEGLDTDLPSASERRVFGRHWLGRLIWLSNQLVVYALRPCVLHPKRLGRLHALNAALQAGCVTGMVAHHGWAPVRWLIVCMWLAGGLHPTAGHFVAEHYDVTGTGAATSSYYGPLNCVTFNVGAHREHHDFPRIPWSRLMQVRKLDPARYSTEGQCESWCGALFWLLRTEGSLAKRATSRDR